MGARHAATQASAAGFDFIEIPLLDPAIVDIADTIRLLESLGLTCTCSLGLPADAHLPAAPERARAFLIHAIDVAAELGSQWLTGALYGNLGSLTGSGPRGEDLEAVARTMHDVSAHAADRDVNLGLELVNRYETDLLNTVDQALVLLDRIDAPNVYAHLDTFHANIEEPSIEGAVMRLGDRLGYLHLAESHRAPLGQGHVPFKDIFGALDRIGYGGPMVIEGFCNADPAIRTVTATWNDHGIDPQAFAVAGLEHIISLRTGLAP